MVRGKVYFRSLSVVLCLIMMGSVAWAQDQASKVAVLPFVIHGQESTAGIQQNLLDLLGRQAASEGMSLVDQQEVAKAFRPGEAVQSEEQARAIGRKLGASFALMGSFNQIGNSVSLDARLVDVGGRKKTEVLFAEERGVENLAATTGSVVQQMAVHVMSKAVIADVKIPIVIRRSSGPSR